MSPRIRIAVVYAVALVGVVLVSTRPWTAPEARALLLKAIGRVHPECTWRETVDDEYYEQARMNARFRVAAETVLLDKDGELLLWKSPYGNAWISNAQSIIDARFWAPDLHHWPPRWAQDASRPEVQPGDVVIDAGGHIGESTMMALRLGAALVVVIEPDPLNAAALRRNLRQAIDAGQVLVVEKGVWDSPGTLVLERHGASTMTTVHDAPGEGPVIEVTTIDAIVSSLKLERVDFIKIDIEGAERHALRGATATIRRFRPKLAVGAYHEPDDFEVILGIVSDARGDYEKRFSRCLMAHGRVIPHLIVFE